MVFKTYAHRNLGVEYFDAWRVFLETAREGYDEQDSCEVEMKTEDIMVDANRVRVKTSSSCVN